MSNRTGLMIFVSCCLALTAPAIGLSLKLPIAEGVWVKTDTKCNQAFIAHVYEAGRFGTVYFYGPNQSMGPANETELLSRVSKGQNGFTVVNEGPLEVIALPNGQASVRAYSPSQGVQWVDQVRLCPAPSLSPKMRSALSRLGLLKVR